MFDNINYRFKINENFILKLHEILTKGILENAGKYRNHAIRIMGANVPTVNFLKVPMSMKKLVKDINSVSKDVYRTHISNT